MNNGFKPDTPEFLYHYTTLESLALILINRTFRFSRLSDLNDPLEGKNDSFEHAEKLVYSSSWTASQDDTLPMWKMYAGLDGVRIKLPSDLFASQGEPSHGLWPPLEAALNGMKLNNPVTITLGGRYSHEMKHLSGPDAIEYVPRDNVADIPDVFFMRPINSMEGKREDPTLVLAHVGLTKSQDWAFENEWRFRIPYFMDMSIINGGPEYILKMPLPVETAVFLPFDPGKLDALEVLTGPKFTDGQMILLEALINTHAPKAKIIKSGILIR